MTLLEERARHGLGSVLAVTSLLIAGCGGGAKTPGPPYSIGGSIVGMTGSGLILQNNGGDDLPVTGATFAFATAIDKGAPYVVTVLAQPGNPAQICTISNGSGMATANVANVEIACATTSFTISGAVAGLSGGELVLQNNGGENLALSARGPFTFSTPVASGTPYAVTVLAQPATQPAQVCTVANGSGVVGATAITNVAVNCRRR